MKKALALMLVLTLVLSLFTGCGAQSNPEPASEPAPAEKTEAPVSEPAPAEEGGKDSEIPTELRIGMIQDLTGPASAQSYPSAMAAQKYIEDINAAGGIDGVTKITFIGYDCQADPTQAVNAYRRLVEEDHVSAVYGGHLSAQGNALGPVTEELKVPTIGGYIDTAGVIKPDGSVFEYAYICQLTSEQQAGIEAAFCAKKLNAKKVGILYNEDASGSASLGLGFIKWAEANGLDYAVETYHGNTDKDVSIQLTKLDKAGVDCLYFPTYTPLIADVVVQAREVGLEQPIMGVNFYYPAVLAAGDAVENNTYLPLNVDLMSDELQAFSKELEAEYGCAAVAQCFIAIDALNIIIEAFRLCHSTDPAVLNEYITQVSIDGYQGHLTVDPATHATAVGLSLVFYTVNDAETRDVKFVTVFSG